MKKSMAAVVSVLMAITIVFSADAFTAFAQEPAAPATESQTNQEEKAKATRKKKKVRKGWYTTKSGKRQYYVKGKPVKNKVKKIKKYKYYFNKKGYVVTGKNVRFKGKTYYLSDKGHVRAISKKERYYFPDGTRMTTAESEDWKARINAEKIVAQITNDQMTKREKLRACFDWVMAKPYITYRKFQKTDYWFATYAQDHFLRKGGDCHADAGAFAYMAAAIGYKNVYVCLDCNGIVAQGHAWAEINGKVYDPLFAQAKSFSKNYNVHYGTYVLRPILHINLDYNDKRPRK